MRGPTRPDPTRPRDAFEKLIPLELAITFAQVKGGVHLHVRTCTSLFHILQTAGRIAFKFFVWIGTHQIRVLHKSEMGCICTFARAHPFSISCKRLDGLCSNLVRG